MKRKWRRSLAVLLSAAMMFSTTVTPVYASVSGDMSMAGLCEHHAEHNEDCGYFEGASCNHEHDEECYTLVRNCVHEHSEECYPKTDDSISDNEATSSNVATPSNTEQVKPTECSHVCGENTSCITKEWNCQHEHSEDCGYMEGVPCSFVCKECMAGNGGSGSGNQLGTGTKTECSCDILCTKDSIDMDCLVCSAEGTDLSLCTGEVLLSKNMAEIEVAQIGEGENAIVYTTLQEALDAVEEDETITLLTDVEEEVITAEDISFTLDLNGYTLESKGNLGTTITHQGTGTLTITDSGTEGSGLVSATGGLGIAVYNEAEGNIIIDSGTVSAVSEDEDGIAIYNESTGKIVIGGDAVVTSNCIEDMGGTICLYEVPEDESTIILEIKDSATVTNTTENGYAVYFDSSLDITIETLGQYYSQTTTGIVGKIYPSPIAQIGDKEYGSLQNAFDEVEDGETITMLMNVVEEVNTKEDETNVTLDLNGYTLRSEYGTTITHQGTGTLTITDRSTSSTEGIVLATDEYGIAIYNYIGSITVDGGSVSATGEYGVAIYSDSTGSITVDRGSVSATGEYGIAIYNYSTGKLIIGGDAEVTSRCADTDYGTIYLEEVPEDELEDESTIVLEIKDSATVTNTDDNGYAVCFSNYLDVTGENLNQYYSQTTTGTVGKVYPSSISVAKIGDKEYSSLQTAFKEVADGETITLLADVVANVSTVSDDGVIILGLNVSTADDETSVILDLNGYTLKSENDYIATLTHNGMGTLTIVDNGTEGGGTVSATGEDGCAIYNESTGKVIVESGTVLAIGEFGTAIYNESSNGITVKGGTVSATGEDGIAICNDSEGDITVDGGTVLTTNIYGMTIQNIGSGNVIVNDGTISATGEEGCAIYNESTGSVTISDGTVSAMGEEGYAISNDSTGSILISDGTVSTANGVAIYNYGTGKITICGNAIVTSSCSEDIGSTIYLEEVSEDEPTVVLEVKDNAQVTNTADGYAVYFYDDSGVSGDNITDYYTMADTATVGKVHPQINLKAEWVTLDSTEAVYNGEEQKPLVTVKNGDTTLVENTDYTVAYSREDAALMDDDYTSVGTIIVTVTGMGNYVGEITATFEIKQSATEFEGGVKTYNDTNETTTFTYGDTVTVKVVPKATGTVPVSVFMAKAAPTANQMAIFMGDEQLTDPQTITEGQELTFNINTADKALAIGSNILTAKYVGNDNMADTAQEFTVTLNQKELTATATANQSKVYDGNGNFTNVSLELIGVVGMDMVNAVADGMVEDANVGEDKAFIATGVTLDGTDSSYYSLAKSAVSGNVKITQKALNDATVTVNGIYTYTGNAIIPETEDVIVKNGETILVHNNDYTYTVSNNINVGTANITVTFKGNYTGTATADFMIDTANQNEFALTAISSKKYGDEPFTLTTTGGSGTGEVTFVSSDPTVISIRGTQATILKAGETTITAIKASDNQFNEATASVPVIVAKKALTVTAEDKTIMRGAEMPEFTYMVDGLVNDDSFTAPQIETTATDTNTTGEYPIMVSGGTLTNADSYLVIYQNGKLTVTDKIVPDVTLTANPTSLSGGGMVTLTAEGIPAGGTVTVTCSEQTISVEKKGTEWTATLPNTTADYIFTAVYSGDAEHESVTVTCMVKVTQSSDDNNGDSSSGDNSSDDSSSSDNSSGESSSDDSSSSDNSSDDDSSGESSFDGSSSVSVNVQQNASGPAAASQLSYVVSGNWTMQANGNWTFTDETGITHKNTWIAAYNPYADVAKGQNEFDWFFFNSEGYMMTGWVEENGRWYYLNPVSDGTRGKMLTGWQKIEDKWYYFNEVSDGTRGAMMTDVWIDGYYVDKDGIWK